jgi:hypothetical protein
MAKFRCPECNTDTESTDADAVCPDCGGALKRTPIVASVVKPKPIVARVAEPAEEEDDDVEEESRPRGKTGLSVTTKFFPLAFVLFFCKPRIQIDGKTYPRSWGTHFLKLKPGQYKVRIYFPYLFISECGLAKVKVTIHPGEVTHLTYEMPPWMFAAGSITIRRR